MDASDNSKRRWGQNRRLSFIDLRLQYDGQISRGDLVSFFGISMPQASTDLGVYQELAGDNLAYDFRQRLYLATDRFQPFFGRTGATRYLDELNRIARHVVEEDESFLGFVPSTGVVAAPARTIEAPEVAVLVRAIRDRLALKVRYQSMDHGGPSDLTLSPHAVGFDGLRWHIRAWCHARAVFRDFAIGRLEVQGQAEDTSAVDPANDVVWTTYVSVVLKPHPSLSASQRKYVLRDYGMAAGKCELSCRKAMLFYTLRHLNLHALAIEENPATQHVVIANSDEVAQWLSEDRAGTIGVRNAF